MQRGSIFPFYPTCLNKKGDLFLKINHFKKILVLNINNLQFYYFFFGIFIGQS
jgi:hypothetical protein